jgi:hypothetical protein
MTAFPALISIVGFPPPLEKPVPEDGRFISLPKPAEISIPPLELRSAIESRRSIREYAGGPLTQQELAYLLWCTQGIVERHEPYATFRNVPSAGGRHAFGSPRCRPCMPEPLSCC